MLREGKWRDEEKKKKKERRMKKSWRMEEKKKRVAFCEEKAVTAYRNEEKREMKQQK